MSKTVKMSSEKVDAPSSSLAGDKHAIKQAKEADKVRVVEGLLNPAPSACSTFAMPESSVLSRVRDFLPQIADANARLETDDSRLCGTLDPQILTAKELAADQQEESSSSDEDSSSDDEGSSDSEEEEMDAKVKHVSAKMEENFVVKSRTAVADNGVNMDLYFYEESDDKEDDKILNSSDKTTEKKNGVLIEEIEEKKNVAS